MDGCIHGASHRKWQEVFEKVKEKEANKEKKSGKLFD